MAALLHGILGLLVLTAIAYVLSERPGEIPWKTVLYAILLQVVLAVVLLKLPWIRQLFVILNALVYTLEKATQEGTSFVFGFLGGGAPPFEISSAGGSTYILAFRALPLILVASALSSVLFYWRVLPVLVHAFSWVLRRSLGVGGAEGLSNAANIFIGMVEAPLFVRPYLKDLSRGELFSMMTCGMATIAGTVMVIYASFLKSVLPDAMGHLLVASIISAPAGIAIARIMVPAPRDLKTPAQAQAPIPAESTMDAITAGTVEGVKLLINIIAMLVVLVALVALVNLILGFFPHVGHRPLTLERMLGWIMAPLMWVIGIPWQESVTAGSLMGVKTVLNEFLAYLELGRLPSEALSPRTRVILTYALCGFANFGSLGIMIGGLGVMTPERRSEIVQLGLKSIVAGTLATLMTGTIAGFLYD